MKAFLIFLVLLVIFGIIHYGFGKIAIIAIMIAVALLLLGAMYSGFTTAFAKPASSVQPEPEPAHSFSSAGCAVCSGPCKAFSVGEPTKPIGHPLMTTTQDWNNAAALYLRQRHTPDAEWCQICGGPCGARIEPTEEERAAAEVAIETAMRIKESKALSPPVEAPAPKDELNDLERLLKLPDKRKGKS